MSPPGMRSIPPPTAALQDPRADLGGPGTPEEKKSFPLVIFAAAVNLSSHIGRELVGCFYGLNGAKTK